MEINSNNLYNKDILKTNKFENLNSSSLEKVEDKELREVSNNFEAFFYKSNIGNFFKIN